MVQPLWWAALAVPVLVAKSIIRSGAKGSKLDDSSLSQEEDWSQASFVCERVCTSEKLLKKLGNSAKNPTPGTCVTVCGSSAVDACTDACSRAVCVNLHHVPAWNETCMQRCKTECLKGRAR